MSCAILQQTPERTHIYTEGEVTKKKSGEESVDVRGQMKECRSVDVFLTTALCSISNTDCLKRTIYISQCFTTSGWDGSLQQTDWDALGRRELKVRKFTRQRKKGEASQENWKTAALNNSFFWSFPLSMGAYGHCVFTSLATVHLYGLSFHFLYWIHMSVE